MIAFQEQLMADLGGVLCRIPLCPFQNSDRVLANSGDSARPRMLWIAHGSTLARSAAVRLVWVGEPGPGFAEPGNGFASGFCF